MASGAKSVCALYKFSSLSILSVLNIELHLHFLKYQIVFVKKCQILEQSFNNSTSLSFKLRPGNSEFKTAARVNIPSECIWYESRQRKISVTESCATILQIWIKKAIHDWTGPYDILVYVIFDIIARLKNFMHVLN